LSAPFSEKDTIQSNGATTADFFGGLTSKSCVTLSIPCDISAPHATQPW